MNESRIELLKKYIEEEPNEPFNHYALANEYLASDTQKALNLFSEVLEKFPDYLPTYYQTAKLLEEFELEEKALNIYTAGIELAKIQGNHKTLNELNSAYQNLLFDM
ncbi:MAG: tetratricopeptide repeat protein [Cytophagia bacterium]|nr:tetratricopeptide repeat protein [Cytophagia bacterium]NVK84409.1 tetratricopeptide repeat protein [Cytophagia bacterium]